MKVQIIRDPAWRARIGARWSVKLMKLGGVVSAGWMAVSMMPGLQQALPAWLPPLCAGVIFFAGAGAAFLHQPNLPPPPEGTNTDANRT